METFDAREDLGKLKGASASHFFACSDNRTYVVKFNLGGPDRTAVNELVSCSLANELNLPIPRVALIRISEKLISLSDELRQRKIPPGLHAGSERVEAAFDFDDPIAKSLPHDTKITNLSDLPGVIVFDTWVMNGDRNNVGNNLLENLQTEPPSFKYWMVDFGHSFTGPSWTSETLVQNKSSLSLMSPFQFVADAVIDATSFEPTLSKLEKLADAPIEGITSLVPQEWGLTEKDRQSLAEFLKYRKATVRGVVLNNANRSHFPNWK